MSFVGRREDREKWRIKYYCVLLRYIFHIRISISVITGQLRYERITHFLPCKEIGFILVINLFCNVVKLLSSLEYISTISSLLRRGSC